MAGCQSTSEKNTGDSTCLSVMGWTWRYSHSPTQHPTPANIATWNSISQYTGGHHARPRVDATVLITAVRNPFCRPLFPSPVLPLCLHQALAISAWRPHSWGKRAQHYVLPMPTNGSLPNKRAAKTLLAESRWLHAEGSYTLLGRLRCPKTYEGNADTDDTSRHPAAETHWLFEEHFGQDNDEDVAKADRRICQGEF